MIYHIALTLQLYLPNSDALEKIQGADVYRFRRSILRRPGVAIALFSFSFVANASDTATLGHSINTARPSFSSPATTLEPGHWQIEGGYQFTSNDDDGVESDNHTMPQVLLRLGVNDRVEVNLFWSGYTDIDSNVGDADGSNDVSIGVSYQITPDDAQLAIGTFATLSLPVGSDEFSSDEPDPSLGVAWSYATDSGPGFFGTFVASSVTSNDERETGFGASLGAAFSLTDNFGTFIEYFGIFSDTNKTTHNLMGGLTYLVSNDVQLDVYGGGGLNNVADDFFIGTGFGWRF